MHFAAHPFLEIDFPPIEGKRSGEAILIRTGRVDPWGKVLDSKVWLIDGGFIGTAEYILEFMKKYYGSTRIDYIIATHPDEDHIGGLIYLIDHADVRNLYIHKPSAYIGELYIHIPLTYEREGHIRSLTASLTKAANLIDRAEGKSIPVHEPFSYTYLAKKIETEDRFLRVYLLGPDEAYYNELLKEFRDYEKYVKEVRAFSERSPSLLEDPPPDATTPENNSSVILLFDFEGDYFLFTGDAGVPALEKALNRFPGGYDKARQVLLFKVPHHGSKNNLGPSLLNKAFGSLGMGKKCAIILAATQDEDHPDEAVVSALRKRGFEVHANKDLNGKNYNQGWHLWFKSQYAPSRDSESWKELSSYKTSRYTLFRRHSPLS
ncbi:MAG: MBL fold metallo-hydrolase [Bacteroidia bacterium]|nr:MBL fold metallo-hydrolase [Bacteroidia bacterium]MDW8236739.1 MBL fold metallo-hydrolase [Bacteroidia bacterium]